MHRSLFPSNEEALAHATYYDKQRLIATCMTRSVAGRALVELREAKRRPVRTRPEVFSETYRGGRTIAGTRGLLLPDGRRERPENTRLLVAPARPQ